jgi:hypothetical protein
LELKQRFQEAAQAPPPWLITETRTLPGQIAPERIYGPRPKAAALIPPRTGLMLTGQVEKQKPQQEFARWPEELLNSIPDAAQACEVRPTDPKEQIGHNENPIPEEPAENLRHEDSNVFHRQGNVWTISYDSENVQLPHINGLEYYSILLKHPGTPLSPKRLDCLIVSKDAPMVTHAAADLHGELPTDCELQDDELDDKGRKKIETRARQIPGGIEEAEARGDLVKAQALREEANDLADCLSKATGRGGRSRKHKNDEERCRQKITQAMHRALKAIARVAPKTANYLEQNIHTGIPMIYLDRETNWKF